jgi:hypothetical protein
MMPVPRRLDPGRHGDQHRREHARIISEAGRAPTGAEYRRRLRQGHHAEARGHIDPIWLAPPRNGMPEFKPYRYRGSGADAFTGEVVTP